MSMPLISIVTPAYNSEYSVANTVRSVLDQTLTDWEFLIVDDASSDGTAGIVRRFCQQDDRIRLLELAENSGAAVARNAGISAAQGRYIAFLDSDDLWLPEKLERQVAFMQEHGLAFSYTGYEMITEEGERTGIIHQAPASVSYADMLRYNRIGCLTAMYDTQLLGKVFMPELRKRQDYALWLKILRQTGMASGLPEVLALYRQREGSISSNKVDLIRYHWRLFREFERLSRTRSAYYLAWNVLGKLFIK